MKYLFVIACFIVFSPIFSQDSLVISFYNVENLFDTINTPYKNDGEFLPTAVLKWNSEKYHRKLQHTARTILAINQWQGPDIIGLCEVENRLVLEDLCEKTALKKQQYEIIHFESPDKRGIDVAMLYKKVAFQPIIAEGIEVKLPDNHPTRLILYVQGVDNQKDTLHLFFNHWASRRGGEIASYPNRMEFSRTLKERVTFIYAKNPQAKIIISGDFNDEIENESVQFLQKSEESTNFLPFLIAPMSFSEKTLKYQGHWNQFDFFLVSPVFMSLKIKAYAFKSDWLVEKDEQFLGEKPFRTFQGKRYLGGYSDHFPVKMIYYFE